MIQAYTGSRFKPVHVGDALCRTVQTITIGESVVDLDPETGVTLVGGPRRCRIWIKADGRIWTNLEVRKLVWADGFRKRPGPNCVADAFPEDVPSFQAFFFPDPREDGDDADRIFQGFLIYWFPPMKPRT
jgi:hypothetical protein